MGNERLVYPIFKCQRWIALSSPRVLWTWRRISHRFRMLCISDVNNDAKQNFKFIFGEFLAETKQLWPLVNAIFERKEFAFARSVGNEEKLPFKEHFNCVIQMQQFLSIDILCPDIMGTTQKTFKTINGKQLACKICLSFLFRHVLNNMCD